ncbi:MAG TPA: exo-beta-N-acetylmuramidase NamZ domain-containing protein [Gemmataceae bacterium]|jgi:uncharacterized protein YbbC (DUF1343 family)|nr:exo-beta-N-acetylmuramidase NamZ domain-containing protein [Gemmataceae bacterium]
MKSCSISKNRIGPVSYLVALGLVLSTQDFSQSTEPSALKSIDVKTLEKIDESVNESIKRGELPGAVVLVIHGGQIVYKKALGHLAIKPTEYLMLPDTVFDLASLTKPIATATSIMILIESGKLRLTDPVVRFLPGFTNRGKEKITIEHLLLHTSGLTADNPEADYLEGKDKALENISKLSLEAEPGKRFRYSDVGYIVLGQVVEKVACKPLNEFARNRIFAPIGMKDTTFLPDDALKKRAAPNDLRKGELIKGEVHDPRAFHLGGVAGHAGLFSTADDLALFVRMLLGGGQLNEIRILSPLTVKLMTSPRFVPLESSTGLRSLGWDVDTPYSSNRGELFPRGESYGHTGFTGTSIWIDPPSETAVIFLSNRLHPDGKGNVIGIRNRVATIVASALTESRLSLPRQLDLPSSSFDAVKTGIDVLAKEKFARLKGKHVGLVTNHTGVDRLGQRTIDLLHKAEGLTLVAIFSPEHGIRGSADDKVADSKDEQTVLPVYSLYGERRKPSPESLKGIDTLVFDIQDAGCRFYTYISTLGLVLEAAAENKIKVVVLDRPNPLGGLAVEGPLLDAGRESFVGYHVLPIRHGLTVGELAKLFNAEKKLGCDLEVISMEGWRRGYFYDRTGLRWVNPSPNLRSLTATVLYPGIGLLETTNLSVGRGTERPFEWIGAPWIDGNRLAVELTKQRVPGFRCVPMRLTPTSSTHQGKSCEGINLIVDDWSRFHPLDLGIALAATLHRLYPDDWKVDQMDTLLCHKTTLDDLKAGASWREIANAWKADLNRFKELRRKYLLYSE